MDELRRKLARAAEETVAYRHGLHAARATPESTGEEVVAALDTELRERSLGRAGIADLVDRAGALTS